MLPLLAWIPVGTSLVVGTIYLFMGNARPAVKVMGVIVFLAAVYLQFFSRLALIGLLIQVALALALAGWRKLGV